MPTPSQTTGWSTAATRRNTAFLRSVDHDSVTGHGYACTLTLRDCPNTPEEFQRLRTNLIKRLRRMGLVRLHWVVEWQRRRVPHLHIAVWLEDQNDYSEEITAHWIESAKAHRPALQSQTVVTMTKFGGWAEYVSKHSARGAQHYQRNIAARPANWTSSGRVWGKCGDWVVIPPRRVEIAPTGFYALRRITRAWRIAKARSTGNPTQITQARTMLRCHSRDRSSVRGISEWMPSHVTERVLTWLSESGHHVHDYPTSRSKRIKTRLLDGYGGKLET